MTLWPLESKEYGVSALDDTAHTVHRDVILMADASPEGQAIAAALRTQGFAVATSTVERLEASVLDESPRVLIVDIDEPGARDAIERIRDLPERARAELVCLGDPLRAVEVGATTAAGRAFARPVDIHAIIAQIGALADPAPIDEEFIDDSFNEINPRRIGDSIAPFNADVSGAFAVGFQSIFPGGGDANEMGTSIFPPDESPTALLAAHPMQLSPELTELLATAEQKVMLADAFVSMPPAAHADEDVDVTLGEEYLSLLDSPINGDDEAPGTGPEMGQTGAVELATGRVPVASLSTTQPSPSIPRSVADTIPPATSANVSSIGGSPPVDTSPPVPRAVLGQVAVREPIRVREVVSDKLPISYADESSASPIIPRPPAIVTDVRPTTSSSAITVVESIKSTKIDDSQLPTRRIDPPAVVASVKRPVAPIVIEGTLEKKPPTVFPGRLSPPQAPRIDVAPLTSQSSPRTQHSMASMGVPSTVNPSTLHPPTAHPASLVAPSTDPATIAAVPTQPLHAFPPPPNLGAPNPPTVIPPTAKPKSPRRDALPSTTRPRSPPMSAVTPPASSSPAPPSSVPSSPRPTKPTPLLPPPQIRRGAADAPPSVRLAPPVPPPPAPVVVGVTATGELEASLQIDKPTALGPGEAPRALARAIASRATGSLALHHQGAVRRIVLQEGDVVTAGSGIAEESLLSFLAARGDIEREVAFRLAGKLPPGGRHAGAALIAHGYLNQDALWSVLRAHAEWIIGAFLLSDAGTLELEPEPPGRLRAEPSVFGGSMGAEVFVDAVRRVVAPDVALARVNGVSARIDGGSRFSLLAECALRPDEQNLIDEAQGSTIGEFIERSSQDGAPLLYALVCLDVLAVLAPVKKAEKSRVAAHDPLDQEAIRMRVRARLALVEEGDYFAVLGVPRAATSYEIRRAFIDLRRSFEPSRLLTAETVDLAKDVRTVLEVLDEAYEILKDTNRRERYRRAIEAGPA